MLYQSFLFSFLLRMILFPSVGGEGNSEIYKINHSAKFNFGLSELGKSVE